MHSLAWNGRRRQSRGRAHPEGRRQPNLVRRLRRVDVHRDRAGRGCDEMAPVVHRELQVRRRLGRMVPPEFPRALTDMAAAARLHTLQEPRGRQALADCCSARLWALRLALAIVAAHQALHTPRYFVQIVHPRRLHAPFAPHPGRKLLRALFDVSIRRVVCEDGREARLGGHG